MKSIAFVLCLVIYCIYLTLMIVFSFEFFPDERLFDFYSIIWIIFNIYITQTLFYFLCKFYDYFISNLKN